MRKLIGIELVKMRRSGAAWLVALISLGQGVLYAVMDDRYTAVLVRYPRVEYILYTYNTARWFCMAALFMGAYAIAGDFSMGTVRNVMAAGIDKGKYYFSRLWAQMIFMWGLYAGGFAVFFAARILRTGRVNTAYTPAQFLPLFLVMSMQPLAYAAVANLIGVCCRRQLLSVVVSESWLFLVLILRMYVMGEEYYTNAGALRPQGPMACEPMWILERADRYAGPVFSYGFLWYALSAAVIIAAAAAAGYACLRRAELY